MRRLLANGGFSSRIVAVLAIGGLSAAGALGATQSLRAQNSPTEISSFAVNFGDGERAANISLTSFVLNADQDVATAGFVRYHQNIAPLSIPTPFGDVSTGDITVDIVNGPTLGDLTPNGDGTFTFTTTDTYAVGFANDLSALGLQSPVLLTSTTNGTVEFLTAKTGIVNMVWEGQGTIGPQGSEIPFTYACRVNTVFSTQPGDLDINGRVDLSDLGIVLSDYGCTSGCVGDLNGDLVTDLSDVGEVLANFGL